MGHEQSFAKAGNLNLWLYKKDNGILGFRWHIGEDIHSDSCLAFMDTYSSKPCPTTRERGPIARSSRQRWSVSLEGVWHEDPGFTIQCHGIEEGGVDACNQENTPVPCVELTGGVRMPRVMLGTAYIGEKHGAGAQNPEVVESAPAIEAAIDLDVPYQGLDLGSQMHPAYANEAAVGALLAARPGRRKELFLTTKLSPNEHGFQSTLKAFQRSLRLLGTDTIDLYLIHHPSCLMTDNCEGDWVQSWKAMERLYDMGAARAIGVSNFDANILTHLLGDGDTQPGLAQAPVALLQNRADPLALEDSRVLSICQAHGINYQAFSVLGRQWVVGPWSQYWKAPHPILSHPQVQAIAQRISKEHNDSIGPAQVVLKWALQKGWSVVPKTANVDRLESNRRLFHFNLTEADMMILDHLDAPPVSEQGAEL